MRKPIKRIAKKRIRTIHCKLRKPNIKDFLGLPVLPRRKRK